MLDELLKHNKLGNKSELLFLLLNVLPLSKSQKMSDLRGYCTSNHYTIGQSLTGILKLLEFMRLISVSNGSILVDDDFFNLIKNNTKHFELSDFTKTLLLTLRNEGAIVDFIIPDAVRLDADEDTIYIKENLIPFGFMGVRNLLISLGFFERKLLIGSNILAINKDFREFFLTEIINKIKEGSQKRRRKSLKKLKDKLARQELVGKEAELFVLNFERERLSRHPLINNVQRISEAYVNAGYDIESFNDKNSVFIDRFIEVKSCSENVVFYWSINEVEVAKELSDKYFLYLVDRSKMSLPGYVPKIFQNPFQSIFNNEFWKKQPQTWEFSLQEEI